MQNPNFERQSLELTAAQWEALKQLAEDTQSLAPTGPNAGKPAWRTLIKRIADGELLIFHQSQPAE